MDRYITHLRSEYVTKSWLQESVTSSIYSGLVLEYISQRYLSKKGNIMCILQRNEEYGAITITAYDIDRNIVYCKVAITEKAKMSIGNKTFIQEG